MRRSSILTQRNPRGQWSRRAFTLVEVIITMLVIGILAAAAAPRCVNSLAQRKAYAAAQRIAADLELARRTARMASASRAVSFVFGDETYAVEGIQDLDRAANGYTVSLKDAPYGVDLVSADFEGSPQVVFNGYGVPGASGTAVVASGNFTNTVRVDKTTGKVTIE